MTKHDEIVANSAQPEENPVAANDWLLERRIAHEGYPLSEARFGSVEEYVEHLEKTIAEEGFGWNGAS